MATALAAFCLSMTPSLLPREWYLQGIASGISILIGYAVGATVSWLMSKFGFRFLYEPAHRRIAQRALALIAIVVIPLFGYLGARWQHQVRELVGADLDDPNYYALVLVIAFALGRFTVWIARLLRRSARALGGLLGRWIPLPVAKLIGAVAVTLIAITAASNLLIPALADAANHSFSLTDGGTADGVAQPTSPLRSGSPDSLVSWESLGREGRSFIALGPSAGDIAEFTGAHAIEPIRVYTGLDSVPVAPSELSSEAHLQAEADLAVAELRRTGAFDRSVLVIGTSTGRGWINHVAASAIEYMWGGDTSVVSMQYSYLPSPVSWIADTETPALAGQVLIHTVLTAVHDLPAASRPRVLLLGESLGSYGGQGAFASADKMLAAVDGAVWAGTPSFARIWQELTAERTATSPIQHPDVDGCARVCFATRAADLDDAGSPQVVYLQHANDPVVWWSPDLVFHRPEWLAAPPLPDRPPTMRWIPVITFWQVTLDIALSTQMPDGQGHTYAQEYVNAWAAVVPPPGWSPADTAALRAHLADVDTGA